MNKKYINGFGAAAIFVLFGCGLLIGAWFLTEDTRRFVADSYVTDATVVSVESKRERDSEGNRVTTYSPKVKFTSRVGSEIENQSTWWSKHHYEQGEHFALRVAGKNPYQYTENTFFAVWGFSVILWYLGSGILLMGIVFLVTTIRKIANRVAGTDP